MTEEQPEPSDHHVYSWVSFNRDTFEFFLGAVKFYESLLNKDIEAITNDPDLEAILGDRQRETFEIERECRRVTRVREWMEKQIQDGGDDAFDYDVQISHGWVRFIKSVANLYLGHLRNRRNALASRPNVSRHALAAVDQQISYLEEKTQFSLFQKATSWPVLVDEVVETDEERNANGQSEKSVVNVRRPRPVVLDSIEVLDADLRKRCLDLLAQFREDGQQDRLDTVVTEATRILEDRLRQLGRAEATCTGVDLAAFCFGGNDPALVVSDVAAEQEAAHLLFRGVFGFIRNQVHHKLVEDLRAERVLQVVAMIDYLLSVAEGARPKGPDR